MSLNRNASISRPVETQCLSLFSFQTQCQQEFLRRDAKTQRFGKRSEHDPPNVFVHRSAWVQSDQREEIAISVGTVINQADHVLGTCCADFRTNMNPMKKLAKTLKERIDNIVTYCTHGITNGVAEGIDSKIMSIKRRAGGYPRWN